MMVSKGKFWIGLMLIGVVFLGCNESVDPPGAIVSPPPQPETPRSLTASIGDGRIDLSWLANDPGAVSWYKVYFSDSAAAADYMSLVDSTESAAYVMDGLANGRTYYFRISALNLSGLEGEMSRPIATVPGIFSLNLESGHLYTNKRAVTVNLTAPQGTDLMQVSEDSLFVGAHWDQYLSAKTIELSDGDGAKTVYGRFQMGSGGMSIGFVSDSILLDRIAVIDSVTESSGGVTQGAGDTVHFAIFTAEYGGEAQVQVTGLPAIELNDYGLAGDVVASDGIYEIDYVIPIGTELVEAEIIGRFSDPAGNDAPEIKAATRLNAAFPPDPVQLIGYTVSSSELLLEWTRSEISDFGGYRLFRSDDASVDETSFLVTTVTSQSTLNYNDTGLDDTTAYFYRLYVFDENGLSAGSESLELYTAYNDPPDSISIAGNLTGDSLTVEISWLQADDDDFKAYHIMRDINPLPVDYDGALVIKIFNSQSTTSYLDNPAASGDYYYKVFVFDEQGKWTGSNVLTITVP
ncbi:MAG: fibronectin type III domain-containing protein [FCB group bacterium]|nr:fibronectin type III domain-containing protein [FCB group bacterium]